MSASDSADLTSISPDSWPNIPLPLKQAIQLLTHHVTLHSYLINHLSDQHQSTSSQISQIQQTATHFSETLHQNIEKVHQIETLFAAKHKETQEELNSRFEMDRKERVKDRDAVDRRLNEVSTRLTSLTNHSSTTTSDLKNTVKELKTTVKEELERGLGQEIGGIKRDLEGLQTIWREFRTSFARKITESEEMQRNKLDTFTENVEKKAENALKLAKELEKRIKIKENAENQPIEAILAPISSNVSRLETKINEIQSIYQSKFLEIDTKIIDFDIKSQKKASEITELVENRAKFALIESENRFKSLLEVINEQKQALENDYKARLSVLSDDLTEKMHVYVTQELLEIREKLSVRDT